MLKLPIFLYHSILRLRGFYKTEQNMILNLKTITIKIMEINRFSIRYVYVIVK